MDAVTRHRLPLAVCIAALLVGAGGCGTGPSEAPDRMAVVAADTAEAAMDRAAAVEDVSAVETFAPASPPRDSVWVGDPPVRIPGPYRSLPDGWTSGVVRAERPDAHVVIVTGVRVARHEGFDRIVLDLDGPAPGVHLEYVDRPVRACGSGNVVPLAGDGWLRIALAPARAHTDAGTATLATRRWAPGLPAIREAAVTCDFEAEFALVLGVASPEAYRVQALRAPDRLVVDVRHLR